jgi:hypothetical protein
MSSVGYSSNKPAGSAYASAQAAKARRQKIIVGVLCLGLIGVLAWESPTILKVVRGSKTAAPLVVPVVTPPVAPSTKRALKDVRHSSRSDPFSTSVGGASDAGFRDVSAPPGARDPFAAPATTAGAAPTISSTAPLPEQIVIGTPGAGRHASHGWIVILASIPTGRGKTSATSFASSARQSGVTPVSVLNSSNRRPLRGGYWVVYTGPFKTLGEVSSRANSVHSRGYATAYIRELIVYS